MVLSKPSFEISLYESIHGMQILRNIEKAGRTCYKSEKNIDNESAIIFVKSLLRRGHESVLEHEKITVKIICDRGVSHELVRHRIASYSQESTRFCNYKGGVEFIIPPWVDIKQGDYSGEYFDLGLSMPDGMWYNQMLVCESVYKNLLDEGWIPQQARSVLPNSLKTEIVITQNLRQWRHFFKLRALGVAGKPHPQMLEITIPMLECFQRRIPAVFDDLNVEGE